MTTRKLAILTIAVGLMVATLAACSSTGSSAPASTSVAPAASAGGSAAAGVCADAAAVETALTNLKSIDLKTAGKAGLTSAVDTVQTSVTALAASAKDSAGPEVQALTGALASLRTTLEGLTSDASVAEKAADVRTAATGVRTAATALKAKLTQCS